MIALGVADLVVIAGRVLGLGPDATLDLLDVQAAETALTVAHDRGGAEDPAGRAAALLSALLHAQPFHRGNERVALLATLQLLALNGWQVHLDPPEQTKALLDGLRAGRLGVDEAADWLAARLRCAASPRVKETAMQRWLRRRQRCDFDASGEQREFDRFTDRARTAVELARQEAVDQGHNYVGTEHLLLGMLREGRCVAAKALAAQGVTLEAARDKVEQIVGRGSDSPLGRPGLTPRAQQVLFKHAKLEALQLGHNYIGTEHVLLGLLAEAQGLAVQVLQQLGARSDLNSARRQVLWLLTEHNQQQPDHPVPAVADMARENRQLQREVQRLRGLLHRHGIEPDNGTSQTA